MALLPVLPGETPIDLSGLKARGVVNRRQLNDAEAVNVLKAIEKYLGGVPNKRTAPFSLTWARKVHHTMFCDVWKWAGQFRKEDLTIGIPWQHIETSLFNLLKDILVWQDSQVEIVEQAAMLHHRAVQIHPFPNGNGRWSRLLANIWLKLHGHPHTEWPAKTMLASSKSDIREEYISISKKADDGDYAPLIELHRRYTPNAAKP
jgi:Fic-DOC domain mobile mystery protein B